MSLRLSAPVATGAPVARGARQHAEPPTAHRDAQSLQLAPATHAHSTYRHRHPRCSQQLTDSPCMQDEPASGPTTASSPQAPPPHAPSDCPRKRLLRATGADGKRVVVHVYDLPPQELHGATPAAAHAVPSDSGSNPSHEGVRADPLEAVVSRVLKPLMRSMCGTPHPWPSSCSSCELWA